MLKILLAVILVSVASSSWGRTVEDTCKAVCKYRDRKAYYIDQKCYAKCVPETRKRWEEERSKRLQDEANQSIIDSNRTYQKNSEDMRRWMRANPGLPYPYPVPYDGTSQRTNGNRK